MSIIPSSLRDGHTGAHTCMSIEVLSWQTLKDLPSLLHVAVSATRADGFAKPSRRFRETLQQYCIGAELRRPCGDTGMAHPHPSSFRSASGSSTYPSNGTTSVSRLLTRVIRRSRSFASSQSLHGAQSRLRCTHWSLRMPCNSNEPDARDDAPTAHRSKPESAITTNCRRSRRGTA